MLILEPSEANPSSQRIMTSSEETTLGKLPHSHSSPANVDSAGSMTPDREVKKPGKLLSVTVRTIDDSDIVFHIQHKALGQVLFDQVCKQLHLLEVDYFGLEYTDSNGVKYWLDHEKAMNRQIGLTLVKPELRFCVKFFTPDPAQLEEEYTRYLFCLQIKRDLALGILQCNDNTAAIMASYIVQAECGDYVAEDYPDHTYLSSYKFFPHQDEELERRIMENHKKHVGQTPAEADLNLLETARRCELYGIKMHPAKDHEGVPLNLAVAHMGVLVFQNYTKINTFSWAKIRKLSFKRKRFLLKLHPEGYGYYKDTVEFYFDGRNECKNFWKKCVEHHGFFRCATVKKLPRQKTRVLSRGSSFRYSGRTQKQIVDYVRDNYVKRQPFQRSQSFRHSCSAHSGVGGSVGPSISAQPLLPVGDTLTGTPVSHSCGSVALSDDSSPSPVHTSILDPSPMVAVPSSNSSMKPIANGTVHEGPVHRKPLDIVDDDTTHIQEERIHSHTGSHSTLPQGSSRLNQEAPEPNANDNDDNVSHASYHLEDPNMQSQETKGARVGGFKGPESNKAQTHMGDKGRKENAEGQTEQTDEGEGQGEDKQKINGEIPYTLHRRHVDNENVGNNKQNIGEAKQSDDKKDIQIGKNSGKPAKPSRVNVEVEHPKISQSSPTLYARSRLNSPARPSQPPATPSRISDTPQSPATKVVDFVSVHDLPASRSYSSQDDSVNRGSLEEEIFEQLRKRQINEEKNTFLQNAINDSLTQKESLAAAKKAFINAELEQKNADNFAPHNLCNGESFIVNIAELPKPSSVLEEKQNQALKQGILRQFSNSSTDSSSDSADNTILMGENFNLNALRIVEEGDLDPTVQMAVLPCKQKATLTVLPPSPDFRLKFKQVEEASTAFGQDRGLDNLIGENQDDPSDVELLPPDGDLDDDESLERMFPMRTLSRISERSTSDSKASSPSDPSSKRSDPPANGGDLPSDYSTSEDNPPHSNETDSSEQIHQYSGGDVQVYENQYVLPDDDTDTTNPVETRYYLEINSEQEEQLEQLQRRGRYYQQNFDMEENFDDTSSADNDTLCEDMSFPEGMEILEDIEEQTEAFSSETEQDQYEGINIRIHVSPNKSPSPIRTPESYSLDKSAGSGSSKKRHRTVLELHVSNGHILENKHASMNSPNIEHMSNTIVNPYAEEHYHDTTKP